LAPAIAAHTCCGVFGIIRTDDIMAGSFTIRQSKTILARAGFVDVVRAGSPCNPATIGNAARSCEAGRR